jgi:hypothetical protein
MTEREHDIPRASNVESAGNMGTLAGFGANQVLAEHEIDRQPTDRRLHEQVRTILTENDLLPIADLSVAVEDGVVTLRGAARDKRVRERAEEIVALIAGVQALRIFRGYRVAHDAQWRITRHNPFQHPEFAFRLLFGLAVAHRKIDGLSRIIQMHDELRRALAFSRYRVNRRHSRRRSARPV